MLVNGPYKYLYYTLYLYYALCFNYCFG